MTLCNRHGVVWAAEPTQTEMFHPRFSLCIFQLLFGRAHLAEFWGNAMLGRIDMRTVKKRTIQLCF